MVCHFFDFGFEALDGESVVSIISFAVFPKAHNSL